MHPRPWRRVVGLPFLTGLGFAAFFELLEWGPSIIKGLAQLAVDHPGLGFLVVIFTVLLYPVGLVGVLAFGVVHFLWAPSLAVASASGRGAALAAGLFQVSAVLAKVALEIPTPEGPHGLLVFVPEPLIVALVAFAVATRRRTTTEDVPRGAP